MNTQLKKIIENAHNKSDVARALNLPINGKGMRKVSEIIKDYDTSHFDAYWTHKNNLKYEKIKKICPVCDAEFETQKGHKKEKTTCSYSCSNTFHRSGENNPNYIDGFGNNAEYRKICFKHHNNKCVVCDEKNVVEVHHYDGDHLNNKPENLVPLCPTHHRYWHSSFRNLIKEKVDKYVKDFINNMVAIV